MHARRTLLQVPRGPPGELPRGGSHVPHGEPFAAWRCYAQWDFCLIFLLLFAVVHNGI